MLCPAGASSAHHGFMLATAPPTLYICNSTPLVQIVPAGGLVLTSVTLWVVLMLDVKKLLAWKDQQDSTAAASLLEAAAPELASEAPGSPDASCRSEVHPLGTGSSAHDGDASLEKLPGGHDVIEAEAGWAHRSVDLASGLMATGAALAHEREQQSEADALSAHTHARALSSHSVTASNVASDGRATASQGANHDASGH